MPTAMPWRAWLRCIVGEAKAIQLKPISAALARATIAKYHYSGKVVQNSQLHIGVYYQGNLEGAIQLGPPMMRDQILSLVANTRWNGMMELNRMAFSPRLPRNSESRALGILFRLLRKRRPDIDWLLSYSDATQCGDGTIYRAAGFLLTQIAVSKNLLRMHDGSVYLRLSLRPGLPGRRALFAKYDIQDTGQEGGAALINKGAQVIKGYQMRYIYFLNDDVKNNLTVPVLPYSDIERMGAGMYKGKQRAASIGVDAPGFQPGESGSRPTAALQFMTQKGNGTEAVDA